MILITESAKETQEFGERFADKVKSGGVVCLYGDLGAGKTTFVQGVAKGLGVKARIVSPTFILVRRYDLRSQISNHKSTLQKLKPNYLWHVDLYRLANVEEARGVGIEEVISDPNNIVFIEWPEKVEEILPRKHWAVRMRTVSENEREIEIRL